jgi:hypothetical protein
MEHQGVTIANLVLKPRLNSTALQGVPTPQDALPDPGSGLGWVLDFRGGGTLPGIVMSQTRMRAIELIVSHAQLPIYDIPIPGMDGSASGDPHLDSWLHLLLRDPNIPFLPSFYTAVHVSSFCVLYERFYLCLICVSTSDRRMTRIHHCVCV